MNFSKIKVNLRKVYDDLAKYWGSDDSLHDWGREELEEFVKLVKKNGGKKVLDLGCGSGVQSKLLTDQGLAVVGLDISSQMIKEAKKRVPEAKFVVGDMTEMKFDKNSFDGIWARASLLHIPKKLAPNVLGTISRILKKNGILYLAVKEGEGEGEVEDDKYGRRVCRFFAFFTEEELGEFLTKAGFKVKRLKHQRVNFTDRLQVFALKI